MRVAASLNLDTGAGVVTFETPWGQVFYLPTAGARLLANGMNAAADEADAAAALESRIPGAGQTMLAQPQGRA